MVQTERENSSDGSNDKMTGWFLERGVGCLRGLGLEGEFFAWGRLWMGWRRCGENLYGDRNIWKWLS